MPIYEIETDQGVFEIDADREPTMEEALQAISGQSAISTGLSPEKKAQVAKGKAEEQQARQAIIASAQRPAYQKAGEGAVDLIKAGIVDPITGIAKGAYNAPELLVSPEKILPTAAEASRRVGMDLVGLGKLGIDIGNAAIPKTLGQAAFGPAGALTMSIVNALRSRIPTEEEIQAELASAPLQQAIGEERMKVAFEGAQPEVAEGITQAIEIAPPVKAAQALKSTGKGIVSAPRRIRSALKPSNANIGAKLEKALDRQFETIYRNDPQAHVNADTPAEGFFKAADNTLNETSQRLNELRSQVGANQRYGDEIADALDARANALEKSGGRAEDIAGVRARANDFRGKVTDIQSLQDATTTAGRKVDWNAPRTRIESIVDETIQQAGSKTINRELESVAGEEGRKIRSDWADQKLIRDQADARVNKILNSLSPEERSVVVQGLSSAKGVAGLFGILNGYASGALGVAAGVGDAIAKKVAKGLKDPNTIISKLYKELEGTPLPERAPPIPREPPPIPFETPEGAVGGLPLTQQEMLGQQIAAAISPSGAIPSPIGASLPLEAGTVRPTGIAQPAPASFSPTPGTTIPIETLIEQQRTIQALSDALRQIQAQAAQRASVSEQIAQQLGQSSRVPRIFLPEQP